MRLIFIFAIWFAFGTLTASGQTATADNAHTTKVTTETVDTPVPDKDADVMLDADVHMGSLLFKTVPQKAAIKVSGVNQRGGYTVIRSNVPKKPVAGVRYRNARVQLHVSAQFVDPNAAAPSSGARKP